MKVGDRVQTLTGRHGVIRAFGTWNGRTVATVRIEGDSDDDGNLEIPLGCLVPSPRAAPTPGHTAYRDWLVKELRLLSLELESCEDGEDDGAQDLACGVERAIQRILELPADLPKGGEEK